MIKINKIISLSIFSSVILLGANIPNVNSSTIERQIQVPKDVPLKNKGISTVDTSEISDSIKSDSSSETIFIKKFQVNGNTKISSDDILNTIKEFENQDLTFNQIQEILSVVTKLYRDKDYFVARSYVGKQDIVENENILIITILEGTYGSFNIENNSLVDNSIIQQIFDNTKKQTVINSKTIERSMLLINDRAGVRVSKAQISPGEQVGSSDFNIETQGQQRIDGYVVLDNYGSRYTGYNRLQALANVNSPFNIGDKLTLSGLVSNGADLRNGRLAYELPLNSYGLKANFSYSRIDYNLIKEYKSSNYDGNSNIYEVGLSYPILRTTDESLWTRLKYYHKDFNDYVSDLKYEDKNINSFVASVDYEKSYFLGDLPSRLFVNFNFTSGNLSSLNADDGNYNKIDTYISNEIVFNEILSFNSNLTAQKVLGNKNLDGSEDLSLGGAYAVKVYPDSEQSADNGYILNFELLSKLPSINFYSHKVGLFYDMGNVYQEVNTDSTFKRKTLKDIGIGYYVGYKDFFAKAQMAWILNSDQVQSENRGHKNSKLLFQAGILF
ncbi:ShlB/FhaC/HecB family hemolysin secretion/activation protein [Aliarcobacter lanthieri]|uniref:ShlB/FhaC/HecB family hemolysin secretion/activation protein n=1 Tax=Aliarcobacter lanthieri TaxID=1355374 RepID=UPI003AFB3000